MINMAKDSTYQIAIWSVVETGLGITASSLVTLRPLFRWLLDESLSYVRHARSSRIDSGKYPLSGHKTEGLKGSHDPSHGRLHTGHDDNSGVINIVLSPLPQDYIQYSSSQEALYPEAWPTTRHHITVQTTLVQTASDRRQ